MSTSTDRLQLLISETYDGITSGSLKTIAGDARHAVLDAMEGIDNGTYRVATKGDDGWTVNIWVKQAILLYFRLRTNEPIAAGILKFVDKIPVKEDFPKGCRVVPGGSALRYGSHISEGVIVMPPSYINIGAWIGSGTMVDSHALVGSGAQIGSKVHLSAGVQIGGILEPPQAAPVIIEDHAFIGLNCGICEGAYIGEGAVIGAGTTITRHTPIVDITTGETLFAHVPPYSLVIPGGRQKETPHGTFTYQCPLIIRRGDYKNKDIVQEVALWMNE